MAQTSNDMMGLNAMNGGLNAMTGREVVSLSERENAQRTLTYNTEAFLEQSPLKYISPMPQLKKDMERFAQLLGQYEGQVETMQKMIEELQQERENLAIRAQKESEMARTTRNDRDTDRRGKPPVKPNKLSTGEAVAINMMIRKEHELNVKMREATQQVEKVRTQQVVVAARLSAAEDMAQKVVGTQFAYIQKAMGFFKESCLLMRYTQTDLEAKVQSVVTKIQNIHGESASFITTPVHAKYEAIQKSTVSYYPSFQKLAVRFEAMHTLYEACLPEFCNYIRHQYLASAPPLTESEMQDLWSQVFTQYLALYGHNVTMPLAQPEFLMIENKFLEFKRMVAELTSL